MRHIPPENRREFLLRVKLAVVGGIVVGGIESVFLSGNSSPLTTAKAKQEKSTSINRRVKKVTIKKAEQNISEEQKSYTLHALFFGAAWGVAHRDIPGWIHVTGSFIKNSLSSGPK